MPYSAICENYSQQPLKAVWEPVIRGIEKENGKKQQDVCIFFMCVNKVCGMLRVKRIYMLDCNKTDKQKKNRFA